MRKVLLATLLGAWWGILAVTIANSQGTGTNTNPSSCAIATVSQLGCVKPDGTTITINGSGVLSSTGAFPPSGCTTANGIIFNNATPCDATITTGGASSGTINLAPGTITSSVNSVNITQTWNNASTIFDAPIFVNVTPTAFANNSALFDLRLSGVSQASFTVLTGGQTTLNLNSAEVVRVTGGIINFGVGGFSSVFNGNTTFVNSAVSGWADARIARDAGGIIAISNGIDTGTVTSPAAYRAYNLASPGNYERMEMGFAAHTNVASIDIEAGGTGTVRNFLISFGGTSRLDFNITQSNNWTIPGGTGLNFGSGSSITMTASTSSLIWTNGSNFTSNGNGTWQWSNNGNSAIASFSIPVNNSFQHGAIDAAAPIAQTIKHQSVVAGTSNTAGVNTTYIGSLSTGSGTSGDIIFSTGGTGAGATVQNNAVQALRLKGATQQAVFAGPIQVTALQSGTPATYACFDSGGNLISSVAPC